MNAKTASLPKSRSSQSWFSQLSGEIRVLLAACLCVLALLVLVLVLNWSKVTSLASNAYTSAMSYIAHTAASQAGIIHDQEFVQPSTSVNLSRSLPLAKSEYTNQLNPAAPQAAEAASAPLATTATSASRGGLGSMLANQSKLDVQPAVNTAANTEALNKAFAASDASSATTAANVQADQAASAASGAAPTWTGFSPSTMAELLKANAMVVVNHLTPSDLHARFGVAALGEPSVAIVLFNAPDDAFHGRIVCDDICTNFAMVHADGTQTQIQADRYYGPSFNYNTLSAADYAEAQTYGINVVDSELLGQYLFTTYVPYKKGDYLVISGADDPNQGVNNGADVFISPQHPQEVLFGKDNTANPANK